MKSLTKTLASLAVLAAFALPVSSQAAANLVANGSFEEGALGIGSFSGWTATLGDLSTFVDSSGQTGSLAGQASDGLWSAYFGSTAADGGATITQTLGTSAGQSYLLTFDVANDNAGLGASNSFMVDVAGAQLLGLANVADQGYVHESFEFTAMSAATLLSFSAFNDNGYLQLDNVSVTAMPVPEPASASLMIAALMLGAGCAAARRREPR